MEITGHLFDPGPADRPELDPNDTRSYTVKLTEQRRAQIEQGIHPCTGRPILNTSQTCGSCVHHRPYTTRARNTYHKCLKATGGLTHGPKSDVRVSWPACELFEQAPDCARCKDSGEIFPPDPAYPEQPEFHIVTCPDCTRPGDS